MRTGNLSLSGIGHVKSGKSITIAAFSNKPAQFGNSTVIILIFLISLNLFLVACKREKSALVTIEPVTQYFAGLGDAVVVSPDLNSVEGTVGTIITWKVRENGSNQDVEPDQYTEYSWVLAHNTDDLMRALIVFDAARAWNTETYIFLPVTNAALQIHQDVGLSVPQAIYDEDGMNRIRELVLSGKAPEGSFVDQFDRFYQD
ncbi:MAG: hypothetical protein NTY09_14505 [bacterium]|nr:hypothetical protein [bacterium]